MLAAIGRAKRGLRTASVVNIPCNSAGFYLKLPLLVKIKQCSSAHRGALFNSFLI